MLARDASGAARVGTGIAARDETNTSRLIAQGVVRDGGGALRVFFNSMSAGASPAEVTGLVSSTGNPPVTTSASTASASGGIGPFTYAWSGTGGWTINSPAAATTSFTSPGVAPGDQANGDFSCIVTDASGATAQTNFVLATVTNLGGGGGELIP